MAILGVTEDSIIFSEGDKLQMQNLEVYCRLDVLAVEHFGGLDQGW